MALKVFEAFAGIGTQRMALRNLGIDHEVVAISEIDKFAIKSYEAIHGKVKNLGDITKIKVEDIPNHDLFTYSFPCFTGETLIQTDKGYKRIDEIEVGDLVTTHKNRYKKVTKVVNQGKKPILKVEGMAIDEIKTTQNHPFLVRKKSRKSDAKSHQMVRVFGEPHWLEAEKITREYYLGMPINNESKIPKWKGYTNTWNTGYGDRTYESNLIEPLLTSNDFWWLMGRYVADGWCRTEGGIVIATNEEKLPYLESKIKGMLNYNTAKEPTCYKVHIPLKELSLFVERFGYYAHNKQISQDVIDLPKHLLESFLEGYMNGDGYYDRVKKYYKATTTSRNLVYGLGQCVLKVYNRPYAIYKSSRPKETYIDGRKVSQKETYSIVYKVQDGIQDKAFCEDGYCWFPFNKSSISEDETVYDIEVEEDHSFTANNVIVHNCQDISLAGKLKGLDKNSDTRSSLLWECERIIENKKPKYLLMENVKNLVGKKFKPYFEEWLKVLENLGYSNYWQVLNAKDYGIPQNRERVFCISILDCSTPFNFPEPFKLQVRLKDILESEVDEKFYLSQEQVEKIKFSDYEAKKRQIQEKDYCDTLLARDFKDPKCIEVESKVKMIAGVGEKKFCNNFRQGDRIYDSNGIATCLTASPVGNTGGYTALYAIDKENDNVKPARVGGIFDKDGLKRQSGSIYDKNSVAPALSTMQGGWAQPSVTEDVVEIRSDEGIRTFKGDYCGTIRATNSGGDKRVIIKNVPENESIKIKNATKHGYLEAYDGDGIDLIDPLSKSRRGRVQKQCSPTLTCGSNRGVVVGSTQKNAAVNYDGISPTLTSAMGQGGGHVPMHNYSQNLRVRKLTPLECWRLMGCSDEDFYKAESVNSNAQLYKQAGNAIVVDVLEGIFKRLFLENIKTLRFLIHQEVDIQVDGNKDILEIEANLEKEYPGFFVGFLKEVEVG